MSELFPRLSIEALKTEARNWVEVYKTILAITLHPSPRRLDSLYTLVFEVIDPKNGGWYSLDFALKQVDGSFFGKSFLNVYKAYSEIMTAEELAKCSDIPRRFSEQWDIRTIEKGEQIPRDLSTIDMIKIFPGTSEERKNQKEKILLHLVDRVVFPAEQLWETIVKRLPDNVLLSCTKDFWETAQKVFDEDAFKPITENHLERSLFKFSKGRGGKKREDYMKRIIKKYTDSFNLGPITLNKCHEFKRKVKKNQKNNSD